MKPIKAIHIYTDFNRLPKRSNFDWFHNKIERLEDQSLDFCLFSIYRLIERMYDEANWDERPIA